MYPVIIIDDEETTREGLKKHIKWNEHGFRVVATAKNGIDALDKIAAFKPKLAICDIKMSHMDGIELGQILAENYPECKLIYLSGYTNQSHLREAIRLRALDFFDKPLDIDAFHQRLILFRSELDQSTSLTLVPKEQNHDLFLQELLFEILKTNNPNKNKITDITNYLNLPLKFNRPSFVVMNNKNDLLLKSLNSFIKDYSNDNTINISTHFDNVTYTLVQGLSSESFNKFNSLNHSDFMIIGNQYNDLFEIRNEIPYMLRVFDLFRTHKAGECIHIKNLNEANIVLEVKRILNDLYGEDLSIKEISEYVYLSPQYLCNLYKKETGKTINDELTDIRLEQAKKLLADNSYKIYEISKLVGYSDSSYFSRIFKKKFNLSPSEYREKL